jgi:lipoprotein-anchoring transpeptidase ErfK/SrfK
MPGRRAATAVGAAVLVLTAAAPAPAAVVPAAKSKVERLDNLGRESYFAFVDRASVARKEPKTSAGAVTKLTTRTSEGTDDLVLVIARTTDADNHVWLQVRLAVRPNNTTGWVPEDALSELQPVDTWLRINTRAFRITLVKAGKTVFSARIGVGQPQWPTPKGQFFIRAKLSGYGGAGSVYGPLAFITSATSPTLTDWPGGGIVGVHGTNQPGLIPGRISHGCIRLRNADILKLAKLMPVGTPLTIT